MKKVIIIITIFAIMLTMSSVYAAWSDSVSIGVGAQSAIVFLQYTGRNVTSGTVSYDMTQGPIGTSNPYVSVEETSTHSSWGTNTVVYEIKNMGTVPIVFEGVSMDNQAITTSRGAENYQDFVNVMDVSYTYSNTDKGSSGSVDVTDIESTAENRFSNYQSNVLDANGGTCTLTVTYERNFNIILDFWYPLFRWGGNATVSLVREDNLIYSVQ